MVERSRGPLIRGMYRPRFFKVSGNGRAWRRPRVKQATAGLRLADFFSIKRGLATGDNRFFILSRAAIVERGLPFEFFKPILPGPRHLPSDVIEAEADGAPKIERQRFILD